MNHNPFSMAERIECDERQAQRQRDADEAPALRNLLATVEEQLVMANQEIADRDAEIARLKAALAHAQDFGRSKYIDALCLERDAALEEVAKWKLNYAGAMADYRHEVESRGTPPADDPRIAALCRLTHATWSGNPSAYTAAMREADIRSIGGPMLDLVARR